MAQAAFVVSFECSTDGFHTGEALRVFGVVVIGNLNNAFVTGGERARPGLSFIELGLIHPGTDCVATDMLACPLLDANVSIISTGGALGPRAKRAWLHNARIHNSRGSTALHPGGAVAHPLRVLSIESRTIRGYSLFLSVRVLAGSGARSCALRVQDTWVGAGDDVASGVWAPVAPEGPVPAVGSAYHGAVGTAASFDFRAGTSGTGEAGKAAAAAS